MLPSRRNANFHKIDVFALSPKNNPKTSKFEVQNRSKIAKISIKIDVTNASEKNIVFDVEFFDFWVPTWVPNPEVKFKNRVFFAILGELGPTWAQKAFQDTPREPK